MADPDAPQVRYLPKFWETFKADDGKRRQVNVLDFLANYATCERLRQLTGGVALEHGVWMFNRILEGLDYAPLRVHSWGARPQPHHGVDRPHGAPGQAHRLELCGQNPRARGGNGAKLQRLLPAGGRQKKPLGPETDLYMAAKMLVYMLATGCRTTCAPSWLPACGRSRPFAPTMPGLSTRASRRTCTATMGRRNSLPFDNRPGPGAEETNDGI